MNRTISQFLALIFAAIFSMAAIAEARPMDNNQALNVNKQSIIRLNPSGYPLNVAARHV